MDFQKVNFDDELEGMEAEQLRGLVQEFKDAQDDNIAEFKEASEEIDELEGRVGEVADFESELTEELAEVSPLSEDDLAEFSIGRKRSLLADFSEEEEGEEEEDEDEDEDDEQNFENFGQQGETHDDEAAEQKFAEEYLGDIPGLE